MAFTIQQSHPAFIITPHGRFLGHIEKTRWQQALSGMGDGPNLIVDLSATDFMDSRGVGLLIATAKVVRNQGGDVVLVGLQRRIKHLFVMMHLLGDVFAAYETVADASRRFQLSAAS